VPSRKMIHGIDTSDQGPALARWVGKTHPCFESSPILLMSQRRALWTRSCVRAPRVNDKRIDPQTGERERFASNILPAWAGKSPQVETVLPLLHLRGGPVALMQTPWHDRPDPGRE